MTDIKELFSGVGIVIDESINDQQNGIQKIISSLENAHFPLLKFEQLPDDEMLVNFKSVSFILLDWNLSGVQPIPEATINDNIDFIGKIKKYCFCPIFIFSDEEPNDIIVKLEEKDLYKSDESNIIFVQSKSNLKTSRKLFSEIKKWIKTTSSMYVLKEWITSKDIAKTPMPWDLFSAFSEWPKIFSKSLKNDGSDIDSELILFLQKNLSYRITPPSFDKTILNKRCKTAISKGGIRNLLEAERFVKNTNLPDNPFAGDIYLIDNVYYLNIRPDCDIIREKKDLYLLKGAIVDEASINSRKKSQAIIFDSGEFHEKINSCYVAFINSNILEFKFRKLEIKKWPDIKDHRIGRLLPPYITKIQQKYAFYLQRQGLPAIPKEAIL